MRTPFLLLAIALFATSFDRFVTLPSAGVALAQNVGPLPTPALNPRLGAPPPGGHLGEQPGSPLGAPQGNGAPGMPGRLGEPGAVGGLGEPGSAGRLGTMNGTRLGPPPAGAVAPLPGPNAPATR